MKTLEVGLSGLRDFFFSGLEGFSGVSQLVHVVRENLLPNIFVQLVSE